jgi:hypothetical protein
MRTLQFVVPFTLLVVATAMPVCADEKVGVPVCDDFLVKYEACIATLRPERQEKLKGNVEQLRKSWKALAGDQAMSAKLAPLCTQVADGTRTNAIGKTCKW